MKRFSTRYKRILGKSLTQKQIEELEELMNARPDLVAKRGLKFKEVPRGKFRRMGFSESDLDDLDERMRTVAFIAEAKKLEFKSKGVAVSYVVERAGDLASQYLERTRNAGGLHNAVMGSHYRAEAAIGIADLLMSEIENADRAQVLAVVRSQLLGGEG